MNESHTLYATLCFADKEWEITLEVVAMYCPGLPETRDEPEEPKGFEVLNIKLGDYPESLNEAIAAVLMDELDGTAIEAAEARREEFRERFNLPAFPSIREKESA